MVAGLTLLVLLAVSLTVVRSAGVGLRLTGLPQQTAKFQAISALTGTGYTTSESEASMHHPVRRRILIMLMLTGHLGVVTLASTVILAVTAAEGQTGVIVQVATLLAAVVVICAVAASSRLDHAMCDVIGRLMTRAGWLDMPPYEALYEHGSGAQLAEHIAAADVDLDQQDNMPAIICVNDDLYNKLQRSSGPVSLRAGDRIMCFGHPDDHANLARRLATKDI